MSSRRLMLPILALWLILGCDRPAVTSPATAPSTVPAVAQNDPLPADASDARPRAAHLLIDARWVEFPPAKLAVRSRGGQLLAVLFSDDPPEAIHDSYTGNSFYLEMLLDIADPTQLARAHWSYKAPSSDRADTVNGIYLEGRKRQLQPSDVVIQFDGTESPIHVTLRGTFLMFDSSQDPTMPGRLVPVGGEMAADLIVKSSR